MPNRRALRPSVVAMLGALCLLFPHDARSASLQCIHLPQLFEFYLRHHYSMKTMTETIKERTVEQFIKNMDPSKTMFLDADVAKLRKELPTVFQGAPSGNCTALEAASKLMVQRSKENEDFVRKFVNTNYKLDETSEFTLDPKKRPFSKTSDEKNQVLTKIVHFRMLNYLQSKLKMEEAKQHLVHSYELVTKRLKERKAEDMIANYAEAFALALDPHSSFLSRDSLEDFNIHMQLSLEGIGASLTSQDGLTVIEELIPGGGAERSKLLRTKDKILAVAQEGAKPVSIIDMDLREVVKLIRGKKGTKVKLTILRQGAKSETFDVTIVRDKIDIKEQAAKISYEKQTAGGKTLKIAIIELPSFYGGGGKGSRSCSADVKRLLEEARKEKVDGVVLNLSRNGGGLLEEAVKISGLFIRKGGVVATKDSDTKVQVLADEDDDVAYNGPLVVLTSRLSASASEILAGALKDYKRAIIVGGDHTFGKGTVQVISTLPLELGAMKVTTGMFFIPGGKSTQQVGVESDIKLPSVLNTDEIGEGALDYSLPPQSVPTFVSSEANSSEAGRKWEPVDSGTIRKLADKSADRVNKDAKFAEIRKNIEEAKKNQGVIKLAEIRKKKDEKDKKKKKDGGKEKDAKDAIDPLDDTANPKELDMPYVKEAVNVMSDWLSAR